MKIIPKIILLLSLVLLLVTSVKYAKHHFTLYDNKGDDIAISNYETMIASNSKIKVSTSNLMTIPPAPFSFENTQYLSDYQFEIKEKKYIGKATFSETPDRDGILPYYTFDVHYLPNNPAINCYNPERLLKIELEKKSSNFYLYWCLADVALTIFAFIMIIKISLKK